MNSPTTQRSAEAMPEPASKPLRYISPTLHSLDPQHRPEPSPACETCPASLWFSTGETLKCFCTRMHLIAWDGIEAPIMKCDGRELAILALRETSEE